MKKFLAILLALIMVLGLVACGATTETKTETEKTETTTTTEKKEEPKKEEEKKEETTEEATEELPVLEASVIPFTSTGFVPPAESWGVDYFLENYGLDLDVQPVDSSTDESWNIFWAGGGYADIILPYNGNQGPQLVNEDLVRPISWDMLKENMPRMISLLVYTYGSEEEALNRLTYKGEVWCIPYFTYINECAHVTSIRNDWLEAVGLECPTNLEEFSEVMRAFTEDDPDGNGVDDTYGAASIGYGLRAIAPVFGTADSQSYWLNAEGTAITTNITTDEYRAYLAQLNEWFEAGYLDPEFVTDDRGATRNKFATNVFGIYNDDTWWYEAARGDVSPFNMLIANNPDVDFATGFSRFAGLKNADGEIFVQSGMAGCTGQASIYFGYECSDDVVIRVMQMIDEAVRLYDGSEEDYAAQIEFQTRTAGEPTGEYWYVNEQGGATQVLSPAPELSSEMGWYLFPTAAGPNMDFFKGQPDEYVIEITELAMNTNKYFMGSNVTLPALEGDLVDMKTNINDYFNASKNAFIIGDMDINDDAVWAEYIATLEGYGLNEVIAAYEAGLGL